jgi:hypothetical protein
MGLFGGSGVIGGLDKIFGGDIEQIGDLNKIGRSSYTDKYTQKFLPPELRYKMTGPLLASGIEGIGELLRNPGGLSPNVSEAILPRLAAESESIGQNFRNLQSNQAGAAARGNAPVSIKNALASALDVAQERAQREARRGALTESGQLRRQDLEQMYRLLDTILAFITGGKGGATQALGAAGGLRQQDKAAQMALAGEIASGASGAVGG